MALTELEARFWQRYLDGLRPSERPQAPFVTAGFAGGRASTDRLLGLYLSGAKTAGSSLLEDFVAADDPVPRVGNHWILLAGDGRPRCLLRTVRVEIHAFEDVPEYVAIAEGEGDLSIASWRRAHRDAYGPHLEAWGLDDIVDATVVTEFFQIVLRDDTPTVRP